MKQLPVMVLKGCPYVGVFLYRLCVPNVFGGKSGFDMVPSHIFSQGMLAAITLVWGGPGDGIGRAGARCEVGFPFCSMAITNLSGAGSISSC